MILINSRQILCWIALITSYPCLINPAHGETLVGGVEHTERLPAVGTTLRSGAEFSTNTVKQLTPSNDWVKLPDWFAGTWSISEETRTYGENFRTNESSSEHQLFEARSQFIYGKQQDRQGQIWHYLGTPYASETQMAGVSEIHQVLSKQLVESDDSKISFKTRVDVIRVNNSSRRIITTYQQESITTYLKSTSHKLKMQSSTKVFDQAGNPQSLVKNQATAHKVEGFHIINQEDGKNLRQLFIEYLTTRGLTILAPD